MYIFIWFVFDFIMSCFAERTKYWKYFGYAFVSVSVWLCVCVVVCLSVRLSLSACLSVCVCVRACVCGCCLSNVKGFALSLNILANNLVGHQKSEDSHNIIQFLEPIKFLPQCSEHRITLLTRDSATRQTLNSPHPLPPVNEALQKNTIWSDICDLTYL